MHSVLELPPAFGTQELSLMSVRVLRSSREVASFRAEVHSLRERLSAHVDCGAHSDGAANGLH